MTVVLDASALLAWLEDERGAEYVDAVVSEGIMSAVNWSEVLHKVAQRGRHQLETVELLESLGVGVVAATKTDAESAAAIRADGFPLSLGDRFCLALGQRLDAPVLTADRKWAELSVGADVHLIR